jgi:hypothetical protein
MKPIDLPADPFCRRCDVIFDLILMRRFGTISPREIETGHIQAVDPNDLIGQNIARRMGLTIGDAQ